LVILDLPADLVEDGDPLRDTDRWGPFVDVDVHDSTTTVSRLDLGEPLRACFVCGGAAKHCIVTTRHPRAAVHRAVYTRLASALLHSLTLPFARHEGRDIAAARRLITGVHQSDG
jgi:hypothetical protein